MIRIQAVFEDESLASEQLDGVRRKGEDAEHSFSLKTYDRLILKIEGPLEAAKIEVDAHAESLPKAEPTMNPLATVRRGRPSSSSPPAAGATSRWTSNAAGWPPWSMRLKRKRGSGDRRPASSLWGVKAALAQEPTRRPAQEAEEVACPVRPRGDQDETCRGRRPAFSFWPPPPGSRRTCRDSPTPPEVSSLQDRGWPRPPREKSLSDAGEFFRPSGHGKKTTLRTGGRSPLRDH